MNKVYMNTKTTDELCEKLWIGLVTTMTKSYVEKGVPLIRNSDIKQNKIGKDLINLDTEFANLHLSRTVKTGDVVTVHTGDVGVSSVIPKELNGAHGFATINSRLKKEFILPEYYCWFLNSENFKEQVYQVITGDGRNNLNLNDFIYLKVNYPAFPIQKRIIEFLNITSSIIEKTQTAIAKYKAIKQGMLNDLFTRGIDIKTGKLRPKQEDAPELYKESKLGWIPKEWDAEKLGCIGEFKNGVNKDKFSFGHGTLFVNIGDAYHEILDCSTLNRVAVNNFEKQQYSLINGDVIFVRSSVKPDGVGYNTIFLEFNDDVVFCGFMIRFRLNDKIKYNPEFYNSYFRYLEFRRRLLCVSTVSANTNVNQVALSNLFAIKPNEKEQLEVAKRLGIINNKIHTEENYLHKLHQIKSGLMADLLSGNKLVSIPKEMETQTI